jgi:short-subunit dehydrogenase
MYSKHGEGQADIMRAPNRLAQSASPRNIAITGASSGLGAGLARLYAEPGRTLGLTGRDPERLADIAAICRGLGATVHAEIVDVSNAAAMTRWLLEFDRLAPVDLLIANAGISSGTRPDGEPEGMDLALATVRTNFLGAIHTVEPLLPAMLARGRGHIAIVASVAGYRGLPDSPAYSASKAGARIYGEALRAALEPKNIQVTVIVPGFFASPMSMRFKGAQPLVVSSDRAVRMIAAGLRRKQRRIVFPRALGFALQVADLLPAWLGDRILRGSRFHIDTGPGSRGS